LPNPPEPRFAWARQHGGPAAFALSGVTHTTCSVGVAQALCQLVTAPFEPYDALICTSRAVYQTVRAVTDTYAEYLRDRHGGAPGLRLRLETIPLGVDTEKFRPATPQERAAQRKALRVADDEIVALFVGRLSFHAKANPFPMYWGLAQAARMTGKKVHLVLSGWTANEPIRKAFFDGARQFAPNVRLSVIDGTKPELRFAAWHAADLFTSLVDNIQETFGLVIIEAMACGLPVVATEWDGYRDLVVSGESGYVVPTYMVRDATQDTTVKLLMEEVNYDNFLGMCSQAVVVDLAAAAAAYARLIEDAGLRQRMGVAGRQRVQERFAWPVVVRAYEQLWQSQEAERLDHLHHREGLRKTYGGPACYPAPEHSFAGYPTALLSDTDLVVADPDGAEQLEVLGSSTLTNYVPFSRVVNSTVLRAVLDAAAEPCPLAELDGVLSQAQVSHGAGRATIAWMMKYGLLRRTRRPAPDPSASTSNEA
jgi:glycosyltransferase involved in cell wall biosynthesis